MEKKIQQRESGLALVPFLIFIVLLVGSGLVLNAIGVERAFYQVPASVAVFVAVIFAFVLYKGTFEQKMDSFIRGCINENIAIMYMTCFLSGAFAEVAKAVGGVSSVVNLGLSILPPAYITVGIFLVAAFMALATGSSSGTTAALGPIAFSIGQEAGLNMPMVLAAVLCGAFFGDNLSFISDTTIVATRSQGCEMKDKFRMNLIIALPAAIVTAVLFLIFGKPETVVPVTAGSFSFIKILPYLYVLITAIMGMNLFMVLGSGTLLAGIIGLICKDLTPVVLAQKVYDGFAGMTEIVLLAIFIGGLSNMMAEEGGLNFLMKQVRKMIKGPKSAEVGIAVLTSLADVAVANNTAALIITSDVVKEVSQQYHVDPRRSASLMDIFCCVAQGLLPYGNQILLIGALCAGTVAPIEILPYMWYIMLLGVSAIASIFFPFSDGVIRKNPWNWETEKPEKTQKK